MLSLFQSPLKTSEEQHENKPNKTNQNLSQRKINNQIIIANSPITKYSLAYRRTNAKQNSNRLLKKGQTKHNRPQQKKRPQNKALAGRKIERSGAFRTLANSKLERTSTERASPTHNAGRSKLGTKRATIKRTPPAPPERAGHKSTMSLPWPTMTAFMGEKCTISWNRRNCYSTLLKLTLHFTPVKKSRRFSV